MHDNEMHMDVEIIDTRAPEHKEKVREYARIYWDEHKRKGVTVYDAERLMERRDYFGAMMLHKGLADAMVNGYSKSLATGHRTVESRYRRGQECRDYGYGEHS